MSADGIQAVATVVRGLPTPFPGAVLIVLHRRVAGRWAAVLSRLAGRDVTEPADGDVLKPDQIYVAPGDRHLIVPDGRIRVEFSERVRFARPSINVLFESVAHAYGPRVIGVLLSGYGSDGAAGLHAIAADGIDLTLPLREIGPAIGRLVSEDG
ncbi:MAG TPA: chemotaxis protein CheB [Methylomirabilota bacterium]|nr:chemotaxis protein CheB [Methylomirabilota bacterium]